MTRLFVPREIRSGERRVAASPESVKKMVQAGLEVAVESGAGREAGFADDAYRSAGAVLVTAAAGASGPDGYAAADIIFKVAPPEESEAAAMRAGAYLFCLLDPYRNGKLVQQLVERKVTSFAMELVPRTTRGQAIDVLSSQASIAGYKAVLVGAERLGKIFPLLMTAAGTIQPARVVVLGAGVAGLMALATAKRLGATVEVSDVRPAVKEQVESLGGRFIDLPQMPAAEGGGGYAREVSKEFLEQQRAILKARLAIADVVITTAQVPGKKAPILLTADMVEAMKPGAVVVDIAAAQGGNCELTRVDEEIEHHGVLVLGPSNLPATVPADASLVYSRNLLTLLMLVFKERRLAIPEGDAEVLGTLLTRDGALVHPAFAAAVNPVAG
ncbi:MAG: Re/Si-specific NAD(P)(+) transhydrogenase subunit alpha [Thermoanaerobaculia bacterium]